MSQIKITQVKSIIDSPKNQKLTIQALGLGKISKSVLVESTPQIAGMLRKVHHLVEVKEL
ncbi:50S ribosomal protein L30 [Adhaeribacter pallidiroseus]|uniref:Large ribosomal subunit protein uL30 n=1 Tax=Adhaeribacter pallidiroseus TaxID=2072847 RepID=A0A369QM59_9BACT|nr:50S ribosomal protein L30 [Adhaeribacter pallidiroseus]RDC64745.1 50S ribosomal protein L30 [Adhaeribacter pallidiroseus]